MDIIPIQASSVPCERVFSSGKQTMRPQRSCISAHLMECLQILKFSIRKSIALTFTEGMSWNDELNEFEMAARTAPIGDAEAYGHSLEDKEEDLDEAEDMIKDLREALEEETTEDKLDEDKDDEESFYVDD